MVQHDSEIYISDSQAKQLSDKIKEIAHAMSHKESISDRKAYATEYKALYNKFSITKYTLLPKDKFDEAIKWLQKRMRYTGHKVYRKVNKSEFRNRNFKSIYTRAGNLGMKKSDVLIFAENVLNLKNPISSLKELSDTRLEVLYKKIFSKRK